MDPYNSLDKLPETPIGNQPRWNTIKIVLRFIAIAFEIGAIGVNGYLASQGSLQSLGMAVWLPMSVCTLWSSSELLTLALRRSKSRGIKPGAHVGVELVFFIGLLAANGFVWWDVVANWQSYWTSWRWYDYAYPYLDPALEESVLPLPWIVASFMVVSLLLHFTLFVRACVEVNRRRRDRRIQQVIMAMQRRGHDPLGSSSAAGGGGAYYQQNQPGGVAGFTQSSVIQPPPPSALSGGAPASPQQQYQGPPPPLPAPASELLGEDFVHKYNMLMAHWPTEQERNGGAEFYPAGDEQKVLLDADIRAALRR